MARHLMFKTLETAADPYLGFLDFRSTPTDGLGKSSAQHLFRRRTKTLLSTAGRLLTQPDSTPQLFQAQKSKQAF